SFTITDATFAGNTIQSFAASFEQHCEGQPPALFGTFTYNANVPVPTVASGVARAIHATGATLTGIVNPNGAPASMDFEYGLTAGYGGVSSSQNLAWGTDVVTTARHISGLTCNSLYHFR